MSSVALALLWTARLTALALVLQTVELLLLRRSYSDQGVFRWSVLRAEHAELPVPLRWLFGLLLPYDRFVALLFVRIPLAAALGMGQLWAAPLLLVSHLAICARFRGTFNGGSDYMTSVLLLSLTVAACATSPLATKAALAYITVQLVLSYFVAGLVKLRHAKWRNGEALIALLGSARFRASSGMVRLLNRPGVARIVALSLLTFECAFPLALTGARPAAIFLTLGAGFHLVNARALGLNRFFFAWISAYPALFYFAQALS
jgi:hypothetical protein